MYHTYDNVYLIELCGHVISWYPQLMTSLIIMDELEFDSNLVTTPLVFAIIVAAASQFLVGYNTGASNYLSIYFFGKRMIWPCPCLPNNVTCSLVFFQVS